MLPCSNVVPCDTSVADDALPAFVHEPTGTGGFLVASHWRGELSGPGTPPAVHSNLI